LTIEHRSAIPEPLRDGIGHHLFGCDICQTVCPFNARALGRQGSSIDARFAPDPRWTDVRFEDLLALDDAGFVSLREGSPIGRATREGIARNAAIVLGNAGDPAALPALERARRDHGSEIVREAAAWAIGRITGSRRS
jgi:epoxyqueuosine reductase